VDIPFTETGCFPLMITDFFKVSVRELLPVQTSCIDQADGDGDLYGGMGQITRMGTGGQRSRSSPQIRCHFSGLRKRPNNPPT